MKTRPAGIELFYGDKQTDRQTEIQRDRQTGRWANSRTDGDYEVNCRLSKFC